MANTEEFAAALPQIALHVQPAGGQRPDLPNCYLLLVTLPDGTMPPITLESIDDSLESRLLLERIARCVAACSDVADEDLVPRALRQALDDVEGFGDQVAGYEERDQRWNKDSAKQGSDLAV